MDAKLDDKIVELERCIFALFALFCTLCVVFVYWFITAFVLNIDEFDRTKAEQEEVVEIRTAMSDGFTKAAKRITSLERWSKHTPQSPLQVDIHASD